ncbi:hypothetical protein Gasu2_22770 [Galdieria sulphuraria]|uniref:G-patch domain-containing protein n=1 Tax=Galdieria sulphuraria TaxID=130081 RepID=M2XI25_GALSU|nr:uncharacterized protein Gasu_29640 [Galdieria sulphuraria]EME29747.1 hypothetical protein Gasu_29640 [Galdieria sulphuraria]GJD07958.1 hypothetical protein Gasu2_22770 [Galdieria sulphuraria]|eukprot:XP_005706267.1 hypothetical protein Gasu_29640 [Galdieria sulphuraria]
MGESRTTTTTIIQDKYEQYGPGAKLLYKCGWQQGQKLGKFEQGLSKPISVIKRQDRVGLGAEQKTVWNDLWWERYLSEAINKNLERFEKSDKEEKEELSKEQLPLRNKQRKNKNTLLKKRKVSKKDNNKERKIHKRRGS